MPNSDEPPEWKKHALAEARKGDVCPACLGLGVIRENVPIKHPACGKLFPCACKEGDLTKYLRDASGLKSWLRHARFREYLPTKHRTPQYEAAQQMVSLGYGWLTLWGDYGTSKTFLLACIANHFLEQRKTAVYCSSAKLLDHLRDSYKPDGLGFSDAFAQWADCYALILDEIDAYHSTPWAEDKYRQLLTHRYDLACNFEAVTVFASNVEPGGNDWPASLDWLYSRMTQFLIVKAGGGDVRPLLKEKEEIEL